MPSKNIVKIYQPDTYYHVYNRGVEKRQIFLDDNDYRKFLQCIEEVLLSMKYDARYSDFMVNVKAFCLMPNHFHLLIQQTNERSIASFMQRVSTKYAMYFNWKYGRVGSLFQGAYKAVTITTDEQLIHIVHYIHENARALGKDPLTYRYSSKQFYNSHSPLVLPWLSPEVLVSG